jgi:hypothetical protein
MKLRSLLPVFLALFFGAALFGCSTARKSVDSDDAAESARREAREKRWQDFVAREKAAEEEAEKQGAAMDVAKELLAWASFYKDTLYTTVDFSKLKIPERPRGSKTLVVVAKGVTADFLIAKFRARSGVWCYPEKFNLLESVRSTDETYAVWLKFPRISNSLVVYLDRRGAVTNEGGATLAELLLHTLKLFHDGHMLFPTEVILCEGSRSLMGDVPCIRWQEGWNYEFQIFMYGAMHP